MAKPTTYREAWSAFTDEQMFQNDKGPGLSDRRVQDVWEAAMIAVGKPRRDLAAEDWTWVAVEGVKRLRVLGLGLGGD
jgi:hypothetical protein